MKRAQSWCRGWVGSAIFIALGFSSGVARANFFVADYFNGVVDQYTAAGGFVNASTLSQPTGVTVGPNGNLYAATASDPLNGSAIYTYNPATGAQTGLFASHVSDNHQNNPNGMAFGPDGNLYVADVTYGGVLVYNPSGTALTPLNSASLSNPVNLTFSPSGTLYIADDANIVSYSGGTFSIVNQPAAFSIPHDVGVGLNGNLYVLDISGSTEGIYELNPGTGLANEIVPYNTSPFNPSDLIVGADGNLYVSGVDSGTGDGEILEYGESGTPDGTFANLGPNAEPTYMVDTPEPSALALMGVAGLGAVVWGRRRGK